MSPFVIYADTSNSVSYTAPVEAVEDLFPLYPGTHPSRDVIKIDVSKKLSGDFHRMGLLPALDASRSFLQETGTSKRRRGVWPVIFSAIVPGAGEIYMGYYKRGAILLGGEILSWTGYLYYRDKGLDGRKAYESFADEKWDFNRWIQWHPDAYPLDFTFHELDSIGRTKWDAGGGWPAYHPWINKWEDKQGYYEVIGKYDWFISGWEDFDPILQPHQTDLRTTYRSMRKESDDDLKTADYFIYMSLGIRVFSLVEMLILNTRGDGDLSSKSVEFGENIDLTFRPKGIFSSEIALEYRF